MKLRFLPEAVADVRDAMSYYDQQQPGLGRDFALELGQALRTLMTNPHAFLPDAKGTRRTHTRRFQHTIIYLIEGQEIWIISAAHSSRDGGRWQDRL